MGMAAASAASALNWDNYERVCAGFYQSLFSGHGAQSHGARADEN
jgi:hypothetical protein